MVVKKTVNEIANPKYIVQSSIGTLKGITCINNDDNDASDIKSNNNDNDNSNVISKINIKKNTRLCSFN